jgi:3-oxoacyl-[acyl-carrier protein] reductase
MTNDISIVTGASRGIGRAIALRMAEEGHNVMITARDETKLKQLKEEIKTKNVECEYFAGDVADEKFVNSSVKQIIKQFGKVDHLINNAGIGVFKTFVDSSLDEFKEQMDVNIFGVYNFTKAVIDGMIKQRSGSIINIASLAGKNSFIGGTMYSATKHALLGFTRSLMLEVRQYNIRVSAICPGSVDTELISGSMNPPDTNKILKSEDIAETVMGIIRMPVHALISEVDIRPTNPK